MPDFMKKILWATDFSDESMEALLYADAFAKTFGAEIVAFHAAPDFSPALYDTASLIKGELARRVADFKKTAREKLEKIQEDKGIRFKILIKEGTASKKIVEAAKKEKADLIVMGRKGMSAIERLFIGSVANQVLRSSGVPILLTRKKRGKPRFKKILVPTDFSAGEEKERDFAWKLARGFSADLMLLYVLELHDYEFPPQVLDEMFKAVLERLRKKIRKGSAGFKLDEDVSRAVNAAVGIVDYAESRRYDLIVISTCGPGVLERFFLGSTTEKVISTSRVPIFAIPPSCLRK